MSQLFYDILTWIILGLGGILLAGALVRLIAALLGYDDEDRNR